MATPGLARINVVVVTAGHAQVTNPGRSLAMRSDSLAVETDVHDPTDSP
jgi:hypothetical protein